MKEKTPPQSKKAKKGERILFVGAHPDDIELGCWGSLLYHIDRGDEVYAVVFSKGEKGLDKFMEDRIQVSERAYRTAGMKKENIFLLKVPDTKFPEHREKIFKFLEKICMDFNITRVYTHTHKEYHQDHITLHQETLRAARNVPTILTYESNAHTFPTFSPNYFIDITPHIESKILIIKKHISQNEKKYCEMENIRSLAKLRGYQSRTADYCEAFEIIRMVKQ